MVASRVLSPHVSSRGVLLAGESTFDDTPEVLAVVWVVPVGELVNEYVVHKLGRGSCMVAQWMLTLPSKFEGGQLLGGAALGITEIEAVDLHIGQPLSIDIGDKWMRVYLRKGAAATASPSWRAGNRNQQSRRRVATRRHH